MTVSSCSSSASNGGGFYLQNTGYTNILVTSSTIKNAVAYINGGFIYKTAGTTYVIDL
jgi:hypothetical protein